MVEVRYEDRGESFEVDVIDNGATVDPKAMPRVDLDKYVSERRKGGLGVHLMSTIMDSVTFAARPGETCAAWSVGSPGDSGSADERR